MPRPDLELSRARYFGFLSLSLWTTLGLCLEAAHAFKLSAYLDHPLRRELLVWAHAHGVGLSLVVLAYAAVGPTGPSTARAGRRLRIGSTLMPLGFLSSLWNHSESDPGPAIALVPVGALLLSWSLWTLTSAARKGQDSIDG